MLHTIMLKSLLKLINRLQPLFWVTSEELYQCTAASSGLSGLNERSLDVVEYYLRIFSRRDACCCCSQLPGHCFGFAQNAVTAVSKCFDIHLPNRRQYLCDLQGSQGKPIAPGANSNAPAKRKNSRQQQRVDPHKMFIIVLAIQQ